MKRSIRSWTIIGLVAGFSVVALWTTDAGFSVAAQSGRRVRPTPTPSAGPSSPAAGAPTGSDTSKENAPAVTPAPLPPVGIPDNSKTGGDTPDDSATIKIDTTLVSIPVTALDRTGRYLPFLKKEDFRLFEDGVEQEIAEFTPVTVPLHVVLLLDTSRSTVFRLEDIQAAAVTFVNQLRPDDRVMVVSFDSKVYVDSEFTNNREQLRRAIYRTKTGGGTKLYEAVNLVVSERLNRVEGRKAIVLFTDGVDTESHGVSASQTIEEVEEGDVQVYPIQYDTRGANGPVISTGGGQGLPPVNIPWPQPRGNGRGRWPFAQLFHVNPQAWLTYPQAFPQEYPQIVFQNTQVQLPGRGGQFPGGRGGGGGAAEYEKASRYLEQLATRSGGRVYRASTLVNVQSAFGQIAEELRNQYALNYYPTNTAQDGSFRRIKVQILVPNAAVRAREGYRAKGTPQGGVTTAKERPVLRRQPLASASSDH